MKKNNNLIRWYAILPSIVGIFVLLTAFVLAAPEGADTIKIVSSERHQNQSTSTIQAQAGNVSALQVNHTRITEAWQGYYGNITGTIVLDDGNNQTLYDWALPSPSGEVYASNSSAVSWGNIYCINVSSRRNASGVEGSSVTQGSSNNFYSVTGSKLELMFGINTTDRDGLNETFNDTYTDTTGFRTASVTFDSVDGCSLAHPYTNQAYDDAAWNELLLSDNQSIVFTGLIRENANGFQTGTTDTFDFQLLVLENGHVGSENTVTTYYFFVELT